MASQQFCHLFPMLIWISKMLLPFCTGTGNPRLIFFDTVFVAITGEDLYVHYELNIPANQSADFLMCFDPYNQAIFKHHVHATGDHAVTQKALLQLKMLMSSGEYHCQYKMAKAYCFLRLRDEGYRDLSMVDYTDFIVVAIFSGVLLVFSVLSSVYVFRGTWKKKQIPECGNPSIGRKQNKEQTQAEKPEDDSMSVIIASSTSLYASLEPRPRSIYDVLDCSAVSTESQQRKPPLKPKTSQKPGEKSMQEEGVFESVYENF